MSPAAAPRFTVIVRACDKVASVHNDTRPFGLTKLETIKVCVHSLVRALAAVEHTVLVIGDSLSAEAEDFFAALPGVALRREALLSAERTLALQIELGLAEPDESWVYFCEDDYLHTRDAFQRIAALVTRREEALDTPGGRRNPWARLGGNVAERPLFIHPSDYPDRYRPADRRPGYLFAAPGGHWRQIENTTHTFMAEAASLRRFAGPLRASVRGCDDKQLSRRLYGGPLARGKALCVAPLPGVATHFTEGVMSPYVDWAGEVERNRRELDERGLWRARMARTG